MDNVQVVELTQDNFQDTVQLAARPVLVDFWAPWCGPCRLMTPVVEALAEIYAGRLTIGKVNIDRYPALAAPYGVTSIPTLKLFIGGEVVKTWVGAHYQEQLVRELAKTLRSAGHQGQAEWPGASTPGIPPRPRWPGFHRNRWGSGQSQATA